MLAHQAGSCKAPSSFPSTASPPARRTAKATHTAGSYETGKDAVAGWKAGGSSPEALVHGKASDAQEAVQTDSCQAVGWLAVEEAAHAQTRCQPAAVQGLLTQYSACLATIDTLRQDRGSCCVHMERP